MPGYHLHLLSDDHQHGGHVLDLHCRELKVALHREDELHLALPESKHS
ncbi:alpha-acetolactate decarboxylase [Synechococcus sp. RS9909]|nr:alpha-acetolactate decarboxylase [Synechococcus sp. RS9909]